jgi:predicted transcriptional regulator
MFMASTVIKIPDDIHAKLRWVAYKEQRSQQKIIIDLLRKGLEDVEIPDEAKL